MKNADKPIYPTTSQKINETEFFEYNLANKEKQYSGLTKKEYFTGLAIQGLLANPQYWKRVYKDISTLKSDKDSIECVFAHYSIKIAEELLEQLGEK